MPLGTSSPRCSSCFWWWLVLVLLLMMLQCKEMEADGDAASTSPSIKFDLCSPDRDREIGLPLSFGHRGAGQEEEYWSVDVLRRSVERAAIFRSTLSKDHHQGSDAGNHALPLHLMDEGRLCSKVQPPSGGLSSLIYAGARRCFTPPPKWFVPGGAVCLDSLHRK
jgi:hypothetical protein